MHLAKHMQFHGVNYIVVPIELWDGAKALIDVNASMRELYGGNGHNSNARELYEQMCAYDNSNEPAEIPNE